MLYTFKSPAASNLIMLQSNGERVLDLIGKEPGSKGIILPEQMPAAIAKLEHAMAQEGPAPASTQDTDDDNTEMVSFRQRATPFVEMLKRCHAAGKEIVWGV